MRHAKTPTLPRLTRRRLLCAAAGLPLATLGRQATACEFFSPLLRIDHPWTRATAPGADHAVLIARFDDVMETDRLIGIKAEWADGAVLVSADGVGPLDLEIPKGETVALDEAGTHIRLVGLKAPLQFGRTYPMTMHFTRGGPTPVDLNVDYAQFSFSSRALRR